MPHLGENLGDCHKHESRASGSHAFFSHEYEYYRDDHDTCQESNQCVKELNAVDALHKILLVPEVGGVSNHDTHGDTDAVEELSHGIHDHITETSECQPVKIRNDIYEESVESGAAGCFRSAVDCQCKNRNSKHHDQKDRHQDLRDRLDALIHTSVNDHSRCAKENHIKDDWLHISGDEASEEGIIRSGNSLPRNKDCGIFQDPAADDRIVGKDEERHDSGNHAQPVPFASSQRAVCSKRALFGLSSDTALTHQQGETEGHDQDQVDDQKQSAPVLCCQIWESPQVPQSDCAACCRQDKA